MAAGNNFRVSPLPTAPPTYSAEHMRQFSRVLELYFSRLDAARDSAVLAPAVLKEQTASFVLAPTDANAIITVSSAAATTVTVPNVNTVPFLVGTRLEILRLGTGGVTIAPAAGVTINRLTGLVISGRYGIAQLLHISPNTWVASGNLV